MVATALSPGAPVNGNDGLSNQTAPELTMRTSEAIDKIALALSKAQGVIDPPVKDNKVDAGARKYKYAKLAAVLNAIRKPLSDNQLAITQVPTCVNGRFLLVTRLIHSSGQWLEASFPLRENLLPQELGSLLTYARRYSATSILGIESEDEDDDGQAAHDAAKRHVNAPPPKQGAQPTANGKANQTVKARLHAVKSPKNGQWNMESSDGKTYVTLSPEHAEVARTAVSGSTDVMIRHHANSKGALIVDSIEPVAVEAQEEVEA